MSERSKSTARDENAPRSSLLALPGTLKGTKPQPGQHGQKLARSLYSGSIVSLLRERIISGAIPPGTPLAEARLAQELSVSRGPVRNALQVLEGDGLVSTLPNGRMVVNGFDAADLRDLFDTRYILESAAGERAIANQADPAPLAAAFEAMVAEGTSTAGLVDLDIAFHVALLDLAGSRFLTHAWLASGSVIHAVITITNRHLAAEDPESNFSRIVEAHRQLLDAIEAGDGDVFNERLKEHYAFSESMFPEAWSNGGSEQDLALDGDGA